MIISNFCYEHQGGEAAAELKSDLKAMEKEREVITDRIEKVKARTEAHSHLLEYAQALRRERDRDHELTLQRSQEKEAIDSLQVFVYIILSIKYY